MAEVDALVIDGKSVLGRRGVIRMVAATAALGVGSVALAACGASVPGSVAVTGSGAITAANGKTSVPASMVSVSGGNYTLVAQGKDIWNKQDECTYYFATATQDGTYSCQVKSQEVEKGDGGNGKAGLMARQSGDAGSPMVAVLITTGNGVAFQWRKTYMDAEESWPMAIAIGVNAPIWLQLKKAGDNWTVAYSTDGKTWNNQTSMQVPFSGTSYLIGLAASAHSVSLQELDVFTDLTPSTFKPTRYLDVSASNKTANSSSSSK